MFYTCFDFNLQKFRKYTLQLKIKSIPFAVTPRWFDLKILSLCCPSRYPPTKKTMLYLTMAAFFLVIAILLRLAVWWSTFGSIHCRAFAECEPFGLLPSDTWTNVKTTTWGSVIGSQRQNPKHRTSGGIWMPKERDKHLGWNFLQMLWCYLIL